MRLAVEVCFDFFHLCFRKQNLMFFSFLWSHMRLKQEALFPIMSCVFVYLDKIKYNRNIRSEKSFCRLSGTHA